MTGVQTCALPIFGFYAGFFGTTGVFVVVGWVGFGCSSTFSDGTSSFSVCSLVSYFFYASGCVYNSPPFIFLSPAVLPVSTGFLPVVVVEGRVGLTAFGS